MFINTVIGIIVVVWIFYCLTSPPMEMLTTFNGSLAANKHYHTYAKEEGKTYYPNQYVGTSTYGIIAPLMTGQEKCMKTCGGDCVPYGETGTAYCYEK